jgi:hypothetical protein
LLVVGPLERELSRVAGVGWIPGDRSADAVVSHLGRGPVDTRVEELEEPWLLRLQVTVERHGDGPVVG